jgi:hypothetical protein
VVYQHELGVDPLHDQDDVDESFDIDYPVDQLNATVLLLNAQVVLKLEL